MGIASFFKEVFYVTKTDYFVKSYVVLYLMSPVLNAFAENSNRNTFRNVLIALLVYQTLYGWLFTSAETGRMLHFCSLYMLARYVSIYKPLLSTKSKGYDLMMIVGSIACLTLFYYVPIIFGYSFASVAERYWSYISPFCIIAALHTLLLFSKLNIKTKWIVFFSSSCFAVYLINININVQPYFKEYFKGLYENLNIFLYWPTVVLSVVVFFVICILVDIIRIFNWKLIENRISWK